MIERWLQRVGLMATPEESERFSRVDDDIDRLERVSPGEEAGVRAMYAMAVEPTMYGGTDADGVAQMSVRVPPGSPVDAQRLWVEIAEVVARECQRVGIEIEGGSPEAFRSLIEERQGET